MGPVFQHPEDPGHRKPAAELRHHDGPPETPALQESFPGGSVDPLTTQGVCAATEDGQSQPRAPPQEDLLAASWGGALVAFGSASRRLHSSPGEALRSNGRPDVFPGALIKANLALILSLVSGARTSCCQLLLAPGLDKDLIA